MTRNKPTGPDFSATQFAFVMIFFIIISLPLVSKALGIKDMVSSEERTLFVLADKLSLQNILAFPAAFGDSFNDTFPQRNRLVHAYFVMMTRLFGSSGSPDVVMGKDGWLFYSKEHVIDYYQNLDPPTEAQLAYMHDSLSKIKAFLDSQGVALVIVIPPNKVSIYPEALPSTVQLYSEKARLDQILDYLAVHPVAPIVDLRGRLIAAKAERLVYFPTDTHWTGYGAYIAYHATLSQVQQQFAAVRPYERDELIFSEAPREGGDLTKLLSLQDSYTEQRVSISVPLHLSQASLLDFWPSGDYTYYKTNDRGLPRAVILHDSFFQSLRPLIAEHFSWSTFKRWQPGYATIYRDVEQMTLREQPDVVILEIIERWVYQLLEPQFMTPVE